MFLVVAFWAALLAVQPAGAQSADYKLSPGDSIKVQVYQQPDLTVEARVSETGTISYPLVGAVKLGGLSISEAEKRIANSLQKANILKQPQVNIVLLQVRGNQVSVLGQVQKPGRFPLETNNVRVSDMLAAAGGVTPTGDDVLVLSGTRDGKPFRKSIDIPGLFMGAQSQGRRPDGSRRHHLRGQGADVLHLWRSPASRALQDRTWHDRAAGTGPGRRPHLRGSANRLRLNRRAADGTVVQTEPRLTDPIQPGDVLFVRESLF